MILKSDVEIQDEAIIKTIDRITNQIFKLLHSREEGGDWKTTLKNLVVEIVGMDKMFLDHTDLFPLLCKLEALLTLDQEDDFFMFRKTIFECLGLMNGLKKCLV